jgi:hypothetical protein
MFFCLPYISLPIVYSFLLLYLEEHCYCRWGHKSFMGNLRLRHLCEHLGYLMHEKCFLFKKLLLRILHA